MKRLRNSPRASVAPCTWNGTLTGTPLPATARILATDELGGMWGALVKKYGLPAFAFRLYDRMRRLLRMQVSAGIEVSLTP
jgi:PPOX class probable F420-dependent enzyme